MLLNFDVSPKRDLPFFSTMGNQQSITAAEALCASTKESVNRAVDDYVAFIQHTSVEIDDDIEDLGNELAVLTTAFKESSILKNVGVTDYDRLVADVEGHVNGQKHSLRRLFAHLQESFDIFEDMASAIAYDSDVDEDDESLNDDEAETASDEDEEGEDNLLYAETDDEDSDDEEEEEEGEEGEKGSDDENTSETSFESYEEEVGDDDVLQLCRFAASDMTAAYEDEMREINLPEAILSKRLAMLSEMAYGAAECAVQDAVCELVENVRVAALEDIDNVLCMGMGQGVFFNPNGEDVRDMLREIIAVGAIARQSLEDLPFSRRDDIENAQEDIVNCVEGQIRDTQLRLSDKPEVLEFLMDLDIDDYGDDYIDGQDGDDDNGETSSDDEDEEEEESSDEEEEEPRVVEIEAPKHKGRAAPKKDVTPAKKVVTKPVAVKVEKAAPANKKRKASPVKVSPVKRATRARKN